MSEWQPIETAPRGTKIEGKTCYGPHILGDPIEGVRRLRWWDGNGPGETRWRNFLGDDGNAYSPKHWMPLPEPPK